MIELCTPATAAVVAASIWNEWPFNCDGSMLALVRVECYSSIFKNVGFARGRRSSVTNSGPGLVPGKMEELLQDIDLPVSA